MRRVAIKLRAKVDCAEVECGDGGVGRGKCGAFALEAFEEAGTAGCIAFQKGCAQLVHVVAGDVEHGVADLGQAELAGWMEQAEFLDFLVRRQQIAFHPLGDEVDAGTLGLAEQLTIGCQGAAGGQQLQQVGQLGQLFHLGQVAHVALQDGVQVALEPRATAFGTAAGDGLGVAALQPAQEKTGHTIFAVSFF